MRVPILGLSVALLISIFPLFKASAQFPQGPDGFKFIGHVITKYSKDIPSSTWSIGGETIDRNYTNYHAYKKYLGPLGAKRIRLQGGWSKCEKVKGTYNFNWLDSIVNDAVGQGLKPWIGLSYGNPIYEGGGEPKLAGNFPSSPEALAAWNRWVTLMVDRYKTKVTDWEIWNEPDIISQSTGEQYATFYIRTAEIVRKVQPAARIYAFGLASVGKLDYPKLFFNTLKNRKKLGLVDVVTFHGYTVNPDDAYRDITKLEKLVREYLPDVEMMQGENGCPSTPQNYSVGALSKYDWTELTQAKWDLRRMLGDFGRGYATNVFTISDFNYPQSDHVTGHNSKGLLLTFADKSVDRPKIAYYAVQRAMSVFDSNIKPLKSSHPLHNKDRLSAFEFVNSNTNVPLVTIWDNSGRPVESFKTRSLTVTIHGVINVPVYVDLISGRVYNIPANNWKRHHGYEEFINIPVPDYPIIIADIKAMNIDSNNKH